jgi:hypothetical protein
MTTATKTKTYTSAGSKVTFQPEQRFDNQKMRHYVNGECSVLHCHHYATLFTQLAADAENSNGPTLLTESAAETVYPVLRDYFKKNKITSIEDRLAVAEQWWSFVGMGQAQFHCQDKRDRHMKHSPSTKAGSRSGVCVTSGELHRRWYFKAACAAVFDLNWQKVKVNETQSIACGASTSRFSVNW